MRNLSKFAGFVALAITLLCSCTWAEIPAWVRTAMDSTLPKYEPDTKAVVLFKDVRYTVTGEDEYVEHYRKVVKILRPDGREEGNRGA